MDCSNDDVCQYGFLLGPDKWGAKREDCSLKGHTTRGPDLPIFVSIMHGRLSAMLKKEESEGHIKGVAICRGALRVSHLLFADDSITFCRASIVECERVMKVSEDYERDSG